MRPDVGEGDDWVIEEHHAELADGDVERRTIDLLLLDVSHDETDRRRLLGLGLTFRVALMRGTEMSAPTTLPLGPTTAAALSDVLPVPLPMSRTRCSGTRRAASIRRA